METRGHKHGMRTPRCQHCGAKLRRKGQQRSTTNVLRLRTDAREPIPWREFPNWYERWIAEF